MKLKDRSLITLTCAKDRRDELVFDDALKGFAVRVQSNGTKTFLLQYRAAGVRRRLVIGDWGNTDDALSTAQARQKAEVLRGRVREGRDPWLERREQIAQMREAERAARAATAIEHFTLRLAIEAWQREGLADRSESYRRNAPRRLLAAFADQLNAPAALVTAADGRRVLEFVRTSSGPIAANRVRAYARACMGWNVRRGALVDNPLRTLPPTARERPRERVLSDAEVRAILHAMDLMLTQVRSDYAIYGTAWSAFVRLLLVTGQRRGEVAGMRWDELIESPPGVWTWHIPETRTKNGRSHEVPLSSAAVATIAWMRNFQTTALVLNPASERPLAGFGRFKARLDRLVASPDGVAASGSGLVPWTWHDLRRTCASGLQRLGVRLEVTEAVLNHVSGSRSGIVGVYQRYQWRDEKRAALEVWGQHVSSLCR